MEEFTIPKNYQQLDEASVAVKLANIPVCKSMLGSEASAWQVKEVGDGNINYVYIVSSKSASIIVKQALPYIRAIGESWPFPLSRIYYEYLALSSAANYSPGLVPEVFHYDKQMAVIVMEYCSPHIIMRKGMIAGTIYPEFAEQISGYLASNLLFSSDMVQTAKAKRLQVAEFCGNSELCKATEDVIFTEPYMEHPNNRWTKPYLNDYATALHTDGAMKIAISRLKQKFMGQPQALIHGDLHTGSIMVTETDTKVIDHEFAFYGPMGFDIGALLANLLLNYFAQTGHESTPTERDYYREWVLLTIKDIWQKFASKFIKLWQANAIGDGYSSSLFTDQATTKMLEQERELFIQQLLVDSIGFAAAKMIRRTLGLSHNIDFESIKDERIRATCEARSINLARKMMLEAASFTSIDQLIASAEREYATDIKF